VIAESRRTTQKKKRRANEATNRNLFERLKKLYEEGRKKTRRYSRTAFGSAP